MIIPLRRKYTAGWRNKSTQTKSSGNADKSKLRGGVDDKNLSTEWKQANRPGRHDPTDVRHAKVVLAGGRRLHG